MSRADEPIGGPKEPPDVHGSNAGASKKRIVASLKSSFASASTGPTPATQVVDVRSPKGAAHTPDSSHVGESQLTSDDFRTLIRLSTAKMACFDFSRPLDPHASRETFLSQVYTTPSSLVEGSPTFTTLGGYFSVGDALGKPLSNFMPRSLGFARLFELWHRNGCGGNTFEVEVGNPDGTAAVLQAVLYARNMGEKISRVWCILRDITTQARAVTALTNAELHYRSLVERPGLILFRIRPSEVLDYISPSFVEMLGRHEGDDPKSPTVLLSRLHPDDLPKYELIHLARRTSSLSPIETEFRLLMVNGNYHSFFIRQSPRLAPMGHVEFFDLVAVDIQNHKSLEEEIERGARVALVGQLAAGISHDFNNHLTAILGHLESGLHLLGGAHPAMQNFLEAKNALGACSHMARQLLDLGKGGSPTTRDVSVNEVVQDACSLVSNVIPSTITVIIHSAPRELIVAADRVQLQQAIINLILNSRDAMPNGGRIAVTISAVPAPPGDGSGSPPAVRISVSDTGTGMSPEHAHRVFQPFFTTKQRSGGSGLGLTMVKSIVEAHQGWIDLSTTEGRGTTFSIFLPLPAQESALAVDGSPDTGISLTPRLVRRCVAIAEDDDMIRNMLRAALVSMGCTVNVFENGVLLLDHLKGDSGECHMIIIDDSMPKARGVDLLESVRSLHPDARVVLTSGDPAVGREPILKRLDVTFLAKPFPLTELLSLIQR